MENAARGSGRWPPLPLRLRLQLAALLGALAPQVRFRADARRKGPRRRAGSRGASPHPPPLRAGVAPSWPLASGNLPALGRGQSPPRTPSWRDAPAWRGKGDPTPAPPAAGARSDARPGRGRGGRPWLSCRASCALWDPRCLSKCLSLRVPGKCAHAPSSTDKPGGSQHAPYPPPHAGISEGGGAWGRAGEREGPDTDAAGRQKPRLRPLPPPPAWMESPLLSG